MIKTIKIAAEWARSCLLWGGYFLSETNAFLREREGSLGGTTENIAAWVLEA